MSSAAATLAVDSRCMLGEGVLWCERRAALLWTDIEGARLWLHVPATGVTRQWALPERLGSLALCRSGQLLLALAKGLYLADLDAADEATLPLRFLVAIEPERGAETRGNDGRCDRHGNFVFGTKSERADLLPIGAFYQFSARHGLRRLALPAVAIPNSICFSLDGRTLYYCDSVAPRLWRCDYDPERATVANPRPFADLDRADASPDGSIVDIEGCLWNAQWGAARVVRYRPDGGIERVVPLPVTQPSCCTIGGPGLDRLYVSSARQDLGASALAREPGAGGIFQLTLERALGLAENRFEAP